MFVLRILAFIVGFFVVGIAFRSAIKTLVLPRAAPDGITRFVFRTLRRVFNALVVRIDSYEQRDGIMAFYAPVSLLVLVPMLLVIIDIGFTLLYWAVTGQSLEQAFSLSGSSLVTLGFVAPGDLPSRVLAFGEAAIGMITIALLIAYLPTIYSVFSQRETLVSALEIRAGSPPWGITLIERAFLVDRMDELHGLWIEWERWFVQIEETHTSLSAAVFFRSQRPNRSWITAAGCMLDAASFVRAAVNIPADAYADLMIRSGYLALRYIALPYGIQLKPDPHYPRDPISVTRKEFDDAYDHLHAIGVPMQPDRDQAWSDFAGWRVNYDAALLDLCDLVMAPEAPWSSDRSAGRWYLTPRFKTPNIALDADTQYRARKEAELPSASAPANLPASVAHENALRLRRLDRRLLTRRLRANRRRNGRTNASPQLQQIRRRRAGD